MAQDDEQLIRRLREVVGNATPHATTTLSGTALTDAEDGEALIDLGNGEPVSVPVTGDVRAGDTTPVTVTDGRPTATMPYGAGERIRQEAQEFKDDINTRVEHVSETVDTNSEWRKSFTDTYLNDSKPDTHLVDQSTLDQTASGITSSVAETYETKSNAASTYATKTTVTQTAEDLTTKIEAAQGTADKTATLVRQYGDGVLVCKTGQTVGALVNADGSFDVVQVTWDGDTPTAGDAVASLDKDSVSLLGGTASMDATAIPLDTGESITALDISSTQMTRLIGSQQVDLRAVGDGNGSADGSAEIMILGPEDAEAMAAPAIESHTNAYYGSNEGMAGCQIASSASASRADASVQLVASTDIGSTHVSSDLTIKPSGVSVTGPIAATGHVTSNTSSGANTYLKSNKDSSNDFFGIAATMSDGVERWLTVYRNRISLWRTGSSSGTEWNLSWSTANSAASTYFKSATWRVARLGNFSVAFGMLAGAKAVPITTKLGTATWYGSAPFNLPSGVFSAAPLGCVANASNLVGVGPGSWGTGSWSNSLGKLDVWRGVSGSPIIEHLFLVVWGV